MALKLELDTNFGVVAKDSYHRISSIRLRRSSVSAMIGVNCEVNIYLNKEARDMNKNAFKNLTFSFLTESFENFYIQAYGKLKTLVIEDVDYTKSLDI